MLVLNRQHTHPGSYQKTPPHPNEPIATFKHNLGRLDNVTSPPFSQVAQPAGEGGTGGFSEGATTGVWGCSRDSFSHL